MSTILIADDEFAICQAFSQVIRMEGHAPVVASNGTEALRLAGSNPPDLVFLDVRMPGMDGLEVLRVLHEERPELPVVVMTAHGAMDVALEAMRLGAFDYLGKPIELARIRALLQRALRPATPPGTGELTQPSGRPTLIGTSAAMQQIFKMMALLTDNELTVFILGESGVGKELVARGIHENGPRADKPFIAVNCAAIPEQLVESELFGHERGAFTGAHERRVGRIEAAAGGTLFLDEIGDLPLQLQGKLLRVLQERCYERVGSNHSLRLEARLIAATNRDAEALVRGGRFREDLYYRLNLVTLRIPALRLRPEDIEPLAKHFLAGAGEELNRRFTGFAPAALERLRQHSWPGNVRELEHLVKRSALLAPAPELAEQDLVFGSASPPGPKPETDPGYGPFAAIDTATREALRRFATAGSAPGDSSLFHLISQACEQALIDEALRLCGGNQVAASRMLGVHRTTLRNKAAGMRDQDP